ncbi:unannotated protein [freshwater metagenome]|uniref:Unannotated protein n=1 Tax=freshwater metagenome TaxID=449393 RepID=A0A6J6AVP7_9ZZZZ|nr:hypothetical protein [Actinomycetota bacterium]
MSEAALVLGFRRYLLLLAACAVCGFSACTTIDAQGETVEIKSAIGNYPSEPLSQDQPDGAMSGPSNVPAEVLAAEVAKAAKGSVDANTPAHSSGVPNSFSSPLASPEVPSDRQVPSQNALPPAQPQVAPIVLESGAAQAVENLTSPQDRALAAQALGLIQYDWQNSLKGWELRFLGARTGYRGMTYPADRRIEVYLRSGDSPQSLAHVVAHEMGHAVDLTFFDDGDRRAWMSARKMGSGVPWFVVPGVADFASGCGDFAESFAWWQVGPPAWFGELAPPPTVIQLGVLVSLVVLPGLQR